MAYSFTGRGHLESEARSLFAVEHAGTSTHSEIRQPGDLWAQIEKHIAFLPRLRAAVNVIQESNASTRDGGHWSKVPDYRKQRTALNLFRFDRVDIPRLKLTGGPRVAFA